ncbi:hypothetical protein INR49_024676 [Caranx melampygus]|nr:hypothetical protein INR49_024676 [Caranx melampygus]
MSTEDCGFPGYFTQGLELLRRNFSEKETVSHLIDGLKEIAKQERISGSFLKNTSFCYQSANPIISPKCLYEKLVQVRDYINSEKILSNASVAVKVEC